MVLPLFYPKNNVKERNQVNISFKEYMFSEFLVDALLCLKVEIHFCENMISFWHAHSCIIIAFVTIRAPVLGFIVVK